MPRIVLTDDQLTTLVTALERVELCGKDGSTYRILAPVFTQADIDDANRQLAAGETGSSLDEVLARMVSLDNKS